MKHRTQHSSPEMSFEGFSHQAFLFFRKLERNNTKEWFADHREDYARFVAEPMKQLANTLTPAMRDIDGLFEIRDHRLLSRPYRDIRFSKDRSPYHTAAWIVYKRPGQEWTTAPAFFFEIAARGIRHGMGFYSALPKIMKQLRSLIDENPEGFRKVFKQTERLKHLHIEGEAYTRTIPNPHTEWFQTFYQKKNLYFICEGKPGEAQQPALADRLRRDFISLGPAYRYLMDTLRHF